MTKTYNGPSLNILFLQIVSMADMRSSNPSVNTFLVHLEFPQNLEVPISAFQHLSLTISFIRLKCAFNLTDGESGIKDPCWRHTIYEIH